MEGVQCPKCRVVNYPGLMGFPRCHHCHEQLRQCRYCLHEAEGLCRLPAAGRPPLEAEDGKPYCGAFASRLAGEVAGRSLLRPVTGDPRLFGLTAALVVGVLLLLALIMRDDDRLALRAPEGLVRVTDERAVVEFQLTSQRGEAQQVRLRVTPESLEHYSLESPQPLPGAGGGVEFKVSVTRSGRGTLRLTFLRRPGAPRRCSVTLAVIDEAGHELGPRASALLLGP